jgi:hypothetical protein
MHNFDIRLQFCNTFTISKIRSTTEQTPALVCALFLLCVTSTYIQILGMKLQSMGMKNIQRYLVNMGKFSVTHCA